MLIRFAGQSGDPIDGKEGEVASLIGSQFDSEGGTRQWSSLNGAQAAAVGGPELGHFWAMGKPASETFET